MSHQPEALRLADDLDAEFVQGRITNYTGRNAAAELRRLHALSAELLEALKDVMYWDNSKPEWEAARAAIAKAKGEMK